MNPSTGWDVLEFFMWMMAVVVFALWIANLEDGDE